MVKSKRAVLNLEQGEDVFLYLHEILLSIPSKHNNMTKVTRPSFPACNTEDDPCWGWWGLGMRLGTWYETTAVGQDHQHTSAIYISFQDIGLDLPVRAFYLWAR